MICSGYNPKRSTKELSAEEISRIVPIDFIPAKLSFEQIQQTTADFPFHLSLEFYQLYQEGNGCLPIELGEKDWLSFDNYFPFPDLDRPFYPLREAMEIYQDLERGRQDRDINHRQKYHIYPRLFPISGFERRVSAVCGHEKQQESSPVFTFYSDSFGEPQIECSSLANMMLAWVEVKERGLRSYEKAEREEMKAIWEKYGGRW